MSRLDKIKARADAATKGPWHWRESEPTSLVHVTSPRMNPWNILKSPDWGPTLADAEFIAAAREDVPWLVAQVERLEAWRAEAIGILDYRGEQQRNAEHERDEARIEVARLQRVVDAKPRQPEVDRLRAVVARVDELLDHWDVVDKANSAYAEHIGERSRFAEGIAARAEMLRAALAGPTGQGADRG